jgi:hypothetical protein
MCDFVQFTLPPVGMIAFAGLNIEGLGVLPCSVARREFDMFASSCLGGSAGFPLILSARSRSAAGETSNVGAEAPALHPS